MFCRPRLLAIHAMRAPPITLAIYSMIASGMMRQLPSGNSLPAWIPPGQWSGATSELAILTCAAGRTRRGLRLTRHWRPIRQTPAFFTSVTSSGNGRESLPFAALKNSRSSRILYGCEMTFPSN